MPFPYTINKSQPTVDSPAIEGADEIRNLKNLIADVFGLPNVVSAPIGSFDNQSFIVAVFKPGNTDQRIPGVIRWTGSDWEGWDGQNWVSLTSGTASGTWINKTVALFLQYALE